MVTAELAITPVLPVLALKAINVSPAQTIATCKQAPVKQNVPVAGSKTKKKIPVFVATLIVKSVLDRK